MYYTHTHTHTHREREREDPPWMMSWHVVVWDTGCVCAQKISGFGS